MENSGLVLIACKYYKNLHPDQKETLHSVEGPYIIEEWNSQTEKLVMYACQVCKCSQSYDPSKKKIEKLAG